MKPTAAMQSTIPADPEAERALDELRAAMDFVCKEIDKVQAQALTSHDEGNYIAASASWGEAAALARVARWLSDRTALTGAEIAARAYLTRK